MSYKRQQILDPACGSGAFPMGMLQKLVYVLGKLDPDNARWRAVQKDRPLRKMNDALDRPAEAERQERLREIEENFARHETDYGRKLYLIESCIYGVDIQPIAVEISKLRFFISLLVDQKVDPAAANRGIRPLPNLETRFVAANTLIGIDKPEGFLPNREVRMIEQELAEVRHKYFTARTPKTKAKYREKDRELREKLAAALQGAPVPSDVRRALGKIETEFRRRVKKFHPKTDPEELRAALEAAAARLAECARRRDVPGEARRALDQLAARFRTAAPKIIDALPRPAHAAAALKELESKLTGVLQRLFSDTGLTQDAARKLAQWDPYDHNRSAEFFDPEWMFGIRCGKPVESATPGVTLQGNLAPLVNTGSGQMELAPPPTAPSETGFDIVIGNPPYVRADEASAWNRIQRAMILASGIYETLWEKWDLFVPFIERAYKLLGTEGVATLIVSDAYCHSKYAQKSQKWFLENARILRLDFLGDLRIFEAAVHNLIFFVQNRQGENNRPERRRHSGEFGKVKILKTSEQRNLTCRAFFPEDITACEFGVTTVALADVCYVSVGMVVHANEKVAQGAFTMDDLVRDTKDAQHPKPFVEGKHLDRWLPATHKWLEWGTARAPALFRRPTFPELYEVPEKIMSVDMSAGTSGLRVVYDNQQLYHNHSVWSFAPWHLLCGVRNRSLKKSARYANEKPRRPDLPRREDLETTSRRFAVKYLLAVMNSSVARDFLRSNRRSNTDLYPNDWKKLPIPDVDSAAQAPVVATVERILAAKRADAGCDIAELEAEADARIARLYALPRDEYALVLDRTQAAAPFRAACLDAFDRLGKEGPG